VRRFADGNADFVVAAERVFGKSPRVLDGSRAVQLGDLKLQLEAGEHELWLIERRGALERRVGFVGVRGSIEDALREARSLLEHPARNANTPERTGRKGSDPLQLGWRCRT
jgi:hypothetical protein